MNNYTNYDEMPLALCVEDLMKVLDIGRNTAYALIKSGRLRCIKVGRKWRIPRDALREFLQEKTE